MKHLFLGALLIITGKVVGQSTTPGNVAGGVNDFLGWDNTFPANNFPLMVRHDLNQPIEFYTDAVRRMLLTPYRTATINGFSVKQHAYLGISRQPNAFSSTYKAPFSRIHLVDSTSNSVNVDVNPNGFRDWMKNGITMTGNGDQCYMGHKYRSADESDLVLQWSDDAEYDPYLTDRLRFLFTNDYNSGASTGATSLEGLETFRIFVPSDDEAFVGIGDWFASGTDPDERLHILDRTLRIQQLVPDYLDDTLSRVVVTDGDGRLHWRHVSSLPAATDACEWSMSGTSPNHVYTAVGTASATCPDEVENVGIGTSSPGYKLHVVDNTPVSNSTRGIHVDANSGTASNTGIFIVADSDAGTESAGLVARAYNGTTSVTAISGTGYMESGESTSDLYGVRGGTNIDASATATNVFGVDGQVSASSGSITTAKGVHGKAEATCTTSIGVDGSGRNGTTSYGGKFEATSSTATTNYGVRANANLASTNNYGVYTSASGTGAWALYVNGAQFSSTSTLFTTSDPALKSNIQPADVAAAGELLNAVELHTYEFNPNACPQMQLPSGTQLGVLAPELEVLMPELVREAHQPAMYDEQGVEIHPGLDFKAVGYTGFIPYLIAAFQDQQAQLAELQQDLAACCEGRSMMQGSGAS